MNNLSSLISFLQMIDTITMPEKLVNPIPSLPVPFQIPGLETAQMLESLDISSKLSLDYLNVLQKSVASINQLMPQIMEILSGIEDMEETAQKLREASKVDLLSLSSGIHINGDSVEITEEACKAIQNLTDTAPTDLSVPENPSSPKKMSHRDFVLQVAIQVLSFLLPIFVSLKISADSHKDSENILHEEMKQTQYSKEQTQYSKEQAQYLKEIANSLNQQDEYSETDATDEASLHQFVEELPYWINSLLRDIGEYYPDAPDSIISDAPEGYPGAAVPPESDTGNTDPDTSN